jgi:MoxR-like ATPase
MSGRETACPNCGKAALVPPARPQDANAPKLTLPPAIPSKGPSPAQVCVIAQQIIANIETVIVGKREQVTMAVAVLLAEGHLLVEDVPGVAKTMLARALAQSVGCSFKRIQCTPDLQPSDILGQPSLDRDSGETAFRFGPLFAQVVLVDEINRASPRTQAALLEAMGEASITEGKITYRMERPFMVIATQNPIDQEGIFLLPEAQKDRFLVRMSVGYPSLNEEKQMCERFQLRHPIETLKPVTTPDRIVICQNAVREMRLDSDVCDYILALVRATREHPAALLGASPRGSLGLFRAAQAMAAIQGNDFVSIAQVKTLAENVLGHRLIIRADRKHRYHEGVEVIREFLAGKKPDYGPASPS